MFTITELIRATKGRLKSGGGPHTRASGISIDSRTIKKGEAFVAIKGESFDGHDFIAAAIKKGASCIIKEKGKGQGSRSSQRIPVIEVNDTTKALGDIARFNRLRFDVPVIAVTGSNGKTTTKDMIACVLAAKFSVLKNEGTRNNHIGLPMTLLQLGPEHDIVVLEIGTNHFGEVGYLAGVCQPTIGVITNIALAHLEQFKSLAGVFKEKSVLLKRLAGRGIAVLNADDPLLQGYLAGKKTKPLAFGFGIREQCDFRGRGIRASSGRVTFALDDKTRFRLRTAGVHNVYNALAAAAIARLFGMEYRAVAKRLSAFEFPRGRLIYRTLKGVRFLDDTYNSNPSSLAQALRALQDIRATGKKIFVMGDMLELGSQGESFHCEAGRKAAQVCTTFIAVGALSRLAAKEARKSGVDSGNVFSCKTPQQAREILFTTVAPGRNDVVLVKGSRGMAMEELFK